MLINTLILYLKIQICLFKLSKTDKLITFYSIPIELLLCLEHNPSDQGNIFIFAGIGSKFTLDSISESSAAYMSCCLILFLHMIDKDFGPLSKPSRNALNSDFLISTSLCFLLVYLISTSDNFSDDTSKWLNQTSCSMFHPLRMRYSAVLNSPVLMRDRSNDLLASVSALKLRHVFFFFF